MGATIPGHPVEGGQFERGLSIEGIVVRAGGSCEAQAEMHAEPSGVMHQGEQKVVATLVVAAIPHGEVNRDAAEVDLGMPVLWGGLLGVAGGRREAPVAEGFQVGQGQSEEGGHGGALDLRGSERHAFRVRGLGVTRGSGDGPHAVGTAPLRDQPACWWCWGRCRKARTTALSRDL